MRPFDEVLTEGKFLPEHTGAKNDNDATTAEKALPRIVPLEKPKRKGTKRPRARSTMTAEINTVPRSKRLAKLSKLRD